MFGRIEEGIGVYREEYLKFRRWQEGAIKDNGGKLNHYTWGEYDYRKAIEWNARLDGMAKALGLSVDEEKRIQEEAEDLLRTEGVRD